MPFFLSKRQPNLVEQMDRKDCDPVKLENTYQQFSRINGLLSNWNRIYKQKIRPVFSDSNKEYSLLDVGFGGADIPLSISRWAKIDGIKLNITAIETDSRAFEFVNKLPDCDGVTFINCSSSDLVSQHFQYDVVISNHVLHHLNKNETLSILDDAKKLAKSRVIFNDIERSDLGYLLFNILSRPLFWNSFITEDGLTSIKRCYTLSELKKIAPPGWKVERSFPFRLLLMYEKENES